ncbi:MAG: tetratricopeptide repeat protein [Chitinophagaceae bacterium]
MPNRSTDALFQLVKSLEKSEKRNFKLYVKRNSSSENLKTIQLFDALEKMNDYDERVILKKNRSITKQQLSNIKAQLYKQILSSLRIIKDENNIDIQLHEQMDHARILFNKGLYLQSLKALDRLKELARNYHQVTYMQQALFFEKKIEVLYITRSMQNRADQLSQEADDVNNSLTLVNKLSNLALQLYSWYIQHGHARNEKDIRSIKLFFETNLPEGAAAAKGFYEKLYLYQGYSWYHFIRLDFLQYYRYCQRWVDLFEKNPDMLKVETASYIKGMHNLMGAHFDLLNHEKLAEAIKQFEKFARHKLVTQNDNNRILAYQYLYTARINLYFLQGTFNKGLLMVPHLEEMLKDYGLYLDTHRVLIFYYKIACLYFGSGNNEKAIDYLNRIIHQKSGLRSDLQCYSRLLHLIAHYELGNFELLEYLIKSVYRFMAKMESLSKVEEAIFTFLRQSFHVGAHALKPEFEKLHSTLKKYENNPLERRAFAYLDVISWLESKIRNVEVQEVVRERYFKRGK